MATAWSSRKARVLALGKHAASEDRAALEALAAALGRRLVGRRLLGGSVTGIVMGAAAALLLALVDRLFLPALRDGALDPWTAAMVGAGALLGATWALRHRPGPAALLALADRTMGSRELMVTAWELSAMPAEAPGAELRLDLLARGARMARQVRPAQVLPHAVPRRARVALLLAALVALAPFVPKYVPEAVARELKDKKEASAAGERLRQELARMEKEEQVATPVQAEQAIDKALQVADAMARGEMDRLTSLERIAEAEAEATKARAEMSFEQVQSSFSRAARELEKQGLAGELSKALDNADAAALEKELKALADQLMKSTELSSRQMSQVGEAFDRLAKTMDRHGEGALSSQANEAGEALKDGNAAKGADAIERMAESQRMAEMASSPEKSKDMARALDAAEETQPAVDELRKQDAAGVKKALRDLAQALREGRSPTSYDQAQMKQLGKAMKQLAQELKGTDLQGLSKTLDKAGEKLEQGEARQAAQELKDLDASSVGKCAGIKQGDARMQELSRVLDEARALMGQQGEDLAKMMAQPAPGEGEKGQGQPAEDYGVGTSGDESPSAPQFPEHHNRDRTGDAKSAWTEKYQKKYESLRLEGAGTSPSFVKGEMSGAADYVEFRGIAGKEEPSVTVAAPPGAYRKAAEDALSKEEIPPGYRQQIKQYFDQLPPERPAQESPKGGEEPK